MSARLTHSRSAVSVRSRSAATCAIDRSPIFVRRTASALNSGVNFLRFLRAMNSSSRIFAPSGLSTEAGEDQRATIHDPQTSVRLVVVEDDGLDLFFTCRLETD